MDGLSAFLGAYLYQIEAIINKNPALLQSVSFQSEEANTDSDLKLFFKEFILAHNRLEDPYILNVSFKDSDGVEEVCRKEELSKYWIKELYLPAELTPEHKAQIKAQKKGVYVNPDLYLLISNGEADEYVSVELKSTKNNKIPGSSVQQVSPYEWVIFVQHRNNETKVATGQYVNSITTRLPFPDRSPRPEIGFDILNCWNFDNREAKGGTLILNCDKSEHDLKLTILSDWHNFLVAEWLNTVKSPTVKRNEKWFNHTIRLYSLELLEMYDELSLCEKEQLLKLLRKNTKI